MKSHPLSGSNDGERSCECKKTDDSGFHDAENVTKTIPEFITSVKKVKSIGQSIFLTSSW